MAGTSPAMTLARRPVMAKAKRKVKAARVKAKKRRTKVAARSAKRAHRASSSRARKPQRFIVSHHRDGAFDHGLRPYSAYRDLGISPATGGLVQAHVIRMTKPFDEKEVAIAHYH